MTNQGTIHWAATTTWRDALARSLCVEYPDLGCRSAFDADEPCHKHQSVYYDLADYFFEWMDNPRLPEPPDTGERAGGDP